MSPTSMPATYCPQCGRMVGTVDGRRITHQIRFNEGWCNVLTVDVLLSSPPLWLVARDTRRVSSRLGGFGRQGA